jgi:hypothetical protein
MSTRTRTAVLDWAHRVANGGDEDLSWADGAVADPGGPWVATEDAAGETHFHALALASLLPPAMAEEAEDAAANGEATGVEALQLLLARPLWLNAARRLWWSPLSPMPQLLQELVEAYGVPPEVHQGDPARLARLVARVATWWPRRGHLGPTQELLGAVEEDGRPPEPGWTEQGPSSGMQDEVLAVHDLRWWAARGGASTGTAYRISDGLVRFQPTNSRGWSVLREDLVFEHAEAGSPAVRLPSPAFLRLVPVWVSVRVVASTKGTE